MVAQRTSDVSYVSEVLDVPRGAQAEQTPAVRSEQSAAGVSIQFSGVTVVYVRLCSILALLAASWGILTSVGGNPGTPYHSFGLFLVSLAAALLASALLAWSTNPGMALALHEV